MPAPRKRPAPRLQDRPSRKNTNGKDHLSELIGLQRQEPLTREDREDLNLLIAAAERGFCLSVQCVDCGHPLTAPKSVHRHRGPVCAARARAS